MTTIHFARTWLRHPFSTGSMVPSSNALAAAVVSALPDDDYTRVIELGTGAGNMTQRLAARFGGGRVFGIELDPGLAALARARAPDATIINGNARRFIELVADRSVAGKTAVVSCLPLLTHPRTRQQVLGGVREVIGPDGHLVQFTYVPWQPYPQAERREHGLVGRRASAILLNWPPASVWLYQTTSGKPATRSGND